MVSQIANSVDGHAIPHNTRTAKEMYGTDLPRTIELLKAGARVCSIGSLMFLLLGPQNYQMCPTGIKRIGGIGEHYSS